MANYLEDSSSAGNFLHCVDSRSASDDEDDESDYEARLYSLIHYSEEDAGATTDFTSFSEPNIYVSKHNKTSRLDAARCITEAVDYPKANNKKQQNESSLFNNEQQRLWNVHNTSYSKLSRSAPVKNNSQERASEWTVNKKTSNQKCRSNEFLDVRNNKRTNSELSVTKQNSDLSHEINVTYSTEIESVSKCLDSPIFPSPKTVSFETILSGNKPKKTIDYQPLKSFNSKSSADDACSKENENAGSKSVLDNGAHRRKSNTSLKLNSQNNTIENAVDDAGAIENVDKNSEDNVSLNQTYNLEKVHSVNNETNSENNNCSKQFMTNGLNNKTDDSVIVIDSDSESVSMSSVLEVDVPAKEPPPLLVLTSDNEEEYFPINNMSDEDDIVVLNVIKDSSNNEEREVSEKKKKKKKKNKKLEKSRKKKMEQTTRMPPFQSQAYGSSSTWTESMIRFYNESWGGENFDVNVEQRFMSGNRSIWKVGMPDLYPFSPSRGGKCNNCNCFGHLTTQCPKPRKPDVCIFCGQIGHSKTRCPTPICLRCGSPSKHYDYTCSSCMRHLNSERPCSVCNVPGHFSFECSENWRKYHSVITENDMNKETRTFYKPKGQLFCSNCAGRGHSYDECRNARRQGNSKKRSHSFSKHRNSKRRKLNTERNNQQNYSFFYPVDFYY